jgi:hypothetical protein
MISLPRPMRSCGRWLPFLLGLALSFASATTAVLAAADLDEALRLLQQGEAEQAYQLLVADEEARAGDPNFDYLLGLAALDSGRASRAVFALERVLATDPGHTRARAEIARAYFQLGELDTARAEFEAVRQQGVPAQVAEAMQRFLSAIDQRISGNRRLWRAYIEAGLGWDSNINSATDRSTIGIAIPGFGGAFVNARLPAAGVEQDDGFASIAAGFTANYPLAGQFDLVGGANVAKRENFSDELFETSSVDGHAGIGYTRGLDAFTLVLQGETFLLDNHTFRNAYGVVGGWNREVDARTRVSAFVQIFGLDYPGQDIRDAMRYVAGAGVSHAFDVRYQPVVFASLYGGTEDERRDNVPQLGHDFYGLRLGGEMQVRERLSLFGGFNVEMRNYGGREAFFLRTRDDNRYHVRLGLNYRPRPDWVASGEVGYVNNHSNIVINDYDRVLLAFTLRKEFD